MNILVTGAAGFIGSHLIDKLLDQGHTVTGIDNLSTGRFENLKYHQYSSMFKFIVDTICNRHIMESMVEQCDIVYHMAAPVGVKYIMRNPVNTLLDNVRGIDVVLECCNKYRKPIFIPSSSSIYGKSLDFLHKNPIDPRYTDSRALLTEESYCVFGQTKNHRWAYANTKAFDEFLAFAYHKEFGLPVVCVRFFNVIGPRQTGAYGMVVPSFVQAALRNKPLEVYGDGTQFRCFVYVTDIVNNIVKLMAKPKAYGDLFNLGGSWHISILDLANMIIEKTNSKSEIKFIEFKEAYGDGYEEMMSKAPDITKLKNIIDVKFDYDKDRMLEEIIKYEEARL